jgi:RNA polymerase sigma factor FliA
MYRRITTHLPRPNPTAEQSLLEQLPMVRLLARGIHRRLPQNVEFDDILSAGMVGLMEASAKFDPSKQIKFASFASFRIRGAILDSLRVMDWAPRQLRQQGRAVREAIQTLTARFGCIPSDEVVAADLKTSLSAYQKLLADLHGLEIGALHRLHEDGSGDEEVVYVPAPPEDDPLFRCMRGEIAQRMTEAIKNLSERERRVTTLTYYEQMTLREIALTLGIDGDKVSQIRASAVRHLRSALTDLTPSQPHPSSSGCIDIVTRSKNHHSGGKWRTRPYAVELEATTQETHFRISHVLIPPTSISAGR